MIIQLVGYLASTRRMQVRLLFTLMANTLKIILGEVGTTNYQPNVYALPVDPETTDPLPTKFISWLWISADQVIEPGIHEIPEDQRDNLQWFYDNNFRLDEFGRRHVQYAMEQYNPVSVTVI